MSAKLSHLCHITGWSRQTIEKWISDGDFRLIEKTESGDATEAARPDPGTSRDWDLQNVIRLMVGLRLRAMNAAVDALRAIPLLHGFKSERAYLVIQVFDRDMVRAHGATNLENLHPEWRRVLHPTAHAKRHKAWCAKPGEIAEHIAGVGVIGAHVLDLDGIEAEAEKLLKRAERIAAKLR